MRFLAILEDSFREAVANTVFSIQAGVSLMLVLLVASVSFEPEEPKAALQRLAESLNTDPAEQRLGARRSQPGRTNYQIVAVEPLDGGHHAPSKSYRLTLAVRAPSPAEFEQMRQTPGPTQQFLRDNFGVEGDRRVLEVTDVQAISKDEGRPSPDALTVYFELTTRPTRDTLLFWPHQVAALFGLLDMTTPRPEALGIQVFVIENYLVNGVAAWGTILMSVVITAFLIPNMLRKGSVDLLLVRPLHRVRLLLFKYLSGVTYILANLTVLVTAVWLVLGLRTGIWRPGLLLSIVVMTFFFAVLYSVSALYGTMTRSPITGILVTCIAWFGFFIVGTLYGYVDKARNTAEYPEWVYPVVDTLHAVCPRTRDLDVLMSKVLSRELLSPQEVRRQELDKLPALTWGESLAISGGFVTLLLGVACWRFYRKDY